MKLLFVHIPKTAGTSVWNWLIENGHENWNRLSGLHHESINELRYLNDISDAHSFAVVRNPYSRALSYYYHAQRQGQKFESLEDFLRTVIEPKGYGFKKKKTPYIIYDQAHYVTRNGKIDVDKIYRFENLSEMEKDFGMELGRNMVGKYHPRELNTTEKSLVEQAYARDFELFY